MKVEISEDQNTLTVDGVEYEAKLNDSWPYKPSCKSCVFYDNGFCKIGMETPLGVNASDLRRCEYPYRNDGKSIFWIKKEAEQMTEAPALAPAPHRHFDLIVAWAKDTTQPIWLWSDRYKEWNELNGLYLVWHEDKIYALGDKPTSPPMKKLKVKIELDRNEFEIEVPYDARIQEIDKAILDMATHYMVVTQEVI
jgi:hypothetical protein